MFENLHKVFRITTMLNQSRTKNIYTEDLYMEYLQSKDHAEGGVGEVVGDPTKQVKPYFDFDSNEVELNDAFKRGFIKWIKDTYDMNVSLMSRPSRLKDGKMKYSFRAYIQKHRISQCLITIYFEALFKKYNGIIDTGVYNIGRVMLTLGNKRKIDSNVPPLEMENPNEDMSNVFATYIEESYINLDDQIDAKVRDEAYAKVMKKIEAKKDEKERVKEDEKERVEEDDYEVDNPTVEYIKDIIDHLKPNRTDKYDDWLNGCFAIIGACKKSAINRRKCLDLIHHFSAKYSDKYNEDDVDNWFDKNYRKQMERDGNQYAYGYLMKCLEVDDPEYYNKIRPKTIISAGDDDESASAIVIKKFYKNIIRCGSLLLVKRDNIWHLDKDDVNRFLCNMIRDSDIYFYGVNGKKLFSYSRAVSHQNKCIIAIRNSSLINTDDDFIKNINITNKCYLPFLNGIYSFKSKRLYTYEQLPDIPFLFKINRNFPKFNENALKELMRRFIDPIFPDIEERKAIFIRLARSLAGHIEDKLWYGLGGARNSGKSKLIKILQNAFGKYVAMFNANNLITSKFSSFAEPAKALAWIIPIFNARLICASEIEETDNKTVLNGNLIKRIVSGGDTIIARCNYMNEIEIVPAFTPWFMYNQWYDVNPIDATENLIQFTCPSKFVQPHELVDGCDMFKIADKTINHFIMLEDIIDAFTLFMLDYYSDDMTLPETIEKFNNNEHPISVEVFIAKHFIKTNNKDDCIHMSRIKDILLKYDYKLSSSNLRMKFQTMKIGEYDPKHCLVGDTRSSGFRMVKYVNLDDNGVYDD